MGHPVGPQNVPDKRVERSGAHFATGEPGARRAEGGPRSQGAGRVGKDPPTPPPRAASALQRGPLSPQAVVGDSEYHHFRYRIPPARVRLLEVGGDLQLDSVKIF